MINLLNTDMELDVMSRIISTLQNRSDVWRLYRDKEFRTQKINDYWANVHGIGEPTPELYQADPVHSDGDKWYFWDETGGDRHGPYVNEKDACSEYERYARFLDDGIAWNGR